MDEDRLSLKRNNRKIRESKEKFAKTAGVYRPVARIDLGDRAKNKKWTFHPHSGPF